MPDEKALRAAQESPEEQEARRRDKREEGVRAVKRHWHYQALQQVGAEMPRTPPASPRALNKRPYEHAIQQWRKKLAKMCEQAVRRGDISEVYLEQEHERVVIRSTSCPARPS